MNHLKEVLYLGRFVLTLPALFFAINIAFSLFLITQTVVVLLSNNNGYKAYGSLSDLSDFNFAAAGDWGCDSSGRSADTAKNIVNMNPELVIGLGDYSLYLRYYICHFPIKPI